MNVRKQTKYIVIHCAATPPNMDVGALEIRSWHIRQGWADIGYHFVIRRDGAIESGRPLKEVGAHVKGYNSVSVGICLVGGADKAGPAGKAQNNFTPQQWASLRYAVQKLLDQYPGCEVLGHRDFPGVTKACPSFDARAWWAANRV